ncbi:hypothetical protein BHF71_03270 [Vulcanibacillus modesticaldus]|uniref:Uncharacterized protein n=1 Tax=Vulcanibacillus modesticaldus TaxID=337097 RepID=A0A1D2YST5_9BACI|nr:hypothetical protein [Vulcanibacillus modesticaldus]OEF98055.1 hypothetical protein BHF71_03270 [Vulcanibacillus modesticaldus]
MNEAKKAIILIGIFFIALGGFYFYKINALNQGIYAVEQEIKKEQEYLTLITEQLAKMKKEPTKDDIDSFYYRLPGSKGIPQLFQFFYQISKADKINLISLNLNDDDDVKNQDSRKKNEENTIYQSLTFNMMVTSDKYEQIRSFIQNIYEADRLINLKKLGFFVDEDGPIYELTFDIFYIPDMQGKIPDLEPIITYPPSNKITPVIELED